MCLQGILKKLKVWLYGKNTSKIENNYSTSFFLLNEGSHKYLFATYVIWQNQHSVKTKN